MSRMDRRRRAVAHSPEDRAARERQRQVNRQLRVWTPRRVLGWVVAVVAIAVEFVHWVAHIGYRPIPLTMGAQDLFVGYPAAALLGVVAVIILGQRPTSRRPASRRR